uniref:Ig-like domain-containing protein n=1 Tax=Onchocerca volvulus TaxID=6282 RepID=A0A8R1XNY3_ONCVO
MFILEDEGDYWCRRIDNKQEGEVARIIVAYVEQFPNNSRPTFHPASVHFGQNVTAHCPKTKAVPPAIYTWFLVGTFALAGFHEANGKAIDLSTERIIQNSNGSLRIQQFLRQDIGVYECVARNFAGRASAKTYMNAITHVSSDIFDGGVFRAACQNLSQGGLMWFLIGCLITWFELTFYFLLLLLLCCRSSVMLSYLLCSVFISRSNYWNRTSLYSSLFFQIQPNLVPRFRKVVAPIDDTHRNLRIDVPEQYNI